MRVVLVAAMVGPLGCAVNNDKLQGQLETRAKFDLNCESIQVTPLEKNQTFISSYGVEGCGRRVTYVWGNGSWVMNVSEGEPVEARE